MLVSQHSPYPFWRRLAHHNRYHVFMLWQLLVQIGLVVVIFLFGYEVAFAYDSTFFKAIPLEQILWELYTSPAPVRLEITPTTELEFFQVRLAAFAFLIVPGGLMLFVSFLSKYLLLKFAPHQTTIIFLPEYWLSYTTNWDKCISTAEKAYHRYHQQPIRWLALSYNLVTTATIAAGFILVVAGFWLAWRSYPIWLYH